MWQGTPEARAATVGEGPASWVVEARVRVLHDLGEPLEYGEVLVAHATDPSWASVLFLASALVTDIGGLLSHASVVARELGVPCVVGTKIATRVLRTGDLCRVDGTTGRVEVLERRQPLTATPPCTADELK